MPHMAAWRQAWIRCFCGLAGNGFDSGQLWLGNVRRDMEKRPKKRWNWLVAKGSRIEGGAQGGTEARVGVGGDAVGDADDAGLAAGVRRQLKLTPTDEHRRPRIPVPGPIRETLVSRIAA